MEYIKNNINYILIFIIAFLGTFFQGSFFAYGYIGIIVISVLGLLINNKFKMNVTFWLFAVMPVITLLTALYTNNI